MRDKQGWGGGRCGGVGHWTGGVGECSTHRSQYSCTKISSEFVTPEGDHRSSKKSKHVKSLKQGGKRGGGGSGSRRVGISVYTVSQVQLDQRESRLHNVQL